MKLQVKLTLILLPLVVLPLMVSGWISYVDLRERTSLSIRHELEEANRFLSDQLRLILSEARLNLRVLEKLPVFQRYLAAEDALSRYELLQPVVLSFMRTLQSEYPSFEEIRFLDPLGFEETRSATADLPNVTEDEGGSPYFTTIQASPHDELTFVGPSPDTGQQVFYVSKRVYRPGMKEDSSAKSLGGYLSITIPVTTLQNAMVQSVEETGGWLMLLDENNSELVRDPAIPPETAADALARVRARASGGRAEGHEGYFWEPSGDFLTMRTLRPGINILAVYPAQVLERPLQTLLYKVLSLALISSIIAVLVLIVVVRGALVRPISQLNRVTREIARGNFRQRPPFESQDELGMLAASVSRMGEELFASSEQIQYLAYHDPLTGLPNRRASLEELHDALGRARRNGSRLAVLFLDLDNFKAVNDNYGHQVGDELLNELSKRLQGALREGDFLARPSLSRLGGDEFLILLENILGARDASKVAERILQRVAFPFAISGYQHLVTGSLGIAIYPDNADSTDMLVRNADIAMYEAKGAGKNRYQFYSGDLNHRLRRQLQIEQQLRGALANGEFKLVYQPQRHSGTGVVEAVEALLRWNNPVLGRVEPGVFVPIAEEARLISDIENWVLMTAFGQALTWQKATGRAVRIAVNISPVHFFEGSLVDDVEAAWEATGLDPRLVELEITESVLLKNVPQVAQVLQRLRGRGVGIALDDFGTGYASLGYLHQFPFTSVKVDRYFVRNMVDADGRNIVRAILSICEALEMKSVAEGVENEEQLRILQGFGCDLVQGVLCGKPVEGAAISELLAGDSECASVSDTAAARADDGA